MENEQKNASEQSVNELVQKSEDPCSKLKSDIDILSKVKVLLTEMGSSDVIYDKAEVETSTVDDIALVQCFYGTDISRICATVRALNFNLQMTSKPSSWVFVEAQKSKSDCAFGWLRNYGIKYVFVKISSESDGILLKNPLWNIGVENCSENKICFLDSDVVMCNSDWVDHCNGAFLSGKDVISLASHQYYETDDTRTLHESIGHKWATSYSIDGSHFGFTLGMTRAAWKGMGGLKPALILDDLRTFYEICGDSVAEPFKKWTGSFSRQRKKKLGYNLSLGYAENVACHIWHGDDHNKYKDITDLMSAAGVSDVDSLFDLDGKIPVWKVGSAEVESVVYVLRQLAKNRDIEMDSGAEYAKKMRTMLGHPSEKHPLFVCTVVKDGFALDLSDFVKFRDSIESRFTPSNDNCPPTVAFITDCKKFDFNDSGINAIPLDNKIMSKGKRKSGDESIASLCAKAILSKMPSSRGGVAMYVPFNTKDFNAVNLDVWIPDGVLKFENGVEIVKI